MEVPVPSSSSTSKTKAKGPRLPALARSATPAEIQKHALERLLLNPSKAVHIPDRPAEGVKSLRAPKDMMKNVQGSSAGAGSGEW